ncbi:chemotaxis protein CheW [Pontibacter burrus]|uniref:Purine-binding chemotaxis protein CheW n=1 Tax=Pontibacter burrus TaxID=2704466 RepID=A0A6B3LXD1_9BACT|nr:chemotaxis protein CheW [Pontibacter burrus]NEM98986.1 purine-binding chemotaxis protein CheW [Pontibacter burrus]
MPSKKNTAAQAAPVPVEENTPAPANGKEQQEKSKANEPLLHLIVFKLGAEYYGIKIEQVKEVTVTPSITRMPRTPDFVKGVANIRGDIIAIMDLEERFGIKPVPASSENGITYTLVIEAKEYSIGVVVKEVPQSLNLSVSKMDKAPSFLQDIAVQENYIEGLAKVDNRLIIVLDMYKILSGDEIKQLSS